MFGSGWIFWTWKTQGAPEWDMKDLLANGIFPQPLTARKCKFSSPECALGKSFTSMVLMFCRPWPVRLSMNVSTTEHEPTMLPALAVYLYHARFGIFVPHIHLHFLF